MKQTGLNREMLTYMYGDNVNLFEKTKSDKGSGEPRKMKRILVCGAGGFIGGAMVKRLKEEGHWVRAVDLKYHEFFDAENDLIIADIGHYESEQFTKDLIYDLLTKNFIKFAVRLSQVNTNPIKYL